MKSALHRTTWPAVALPFGDAVSRAPHEWRYVVVLQAPAGQAGRGRSDRRFQSRVPRPIFFPSAAPISNSIGRAKSSSEARLQADRCKQPFGLRWFAPELWRQRGPFNNVVIAVWHAQFSRSPCRSFFQIVIDKVLVHLAVSTLTVIGGGVVIAIRLRCLVELVARLFPVARLEPHRHPACPHDVSPFDGAADRIFRALAGGSRYRHMQQASQIREFLTGAC